MTDGPKSLGALLFQLPAVKRAQKANRLSRVHQRLIEPIETDQDNEARLSSIRFFVRLGCHTEIRAMMCASGSVQRALCRFSSKPGKPDILEPENGLS